MSVLHNEEDLGFYKAKGFQLQEEKSKESSMDNERRQMLCKLISECEEDKTEVNFAVCFPKATAVH